MASYAVCVATCDRPRGLARCLDAIGRMERGALASDRVFVVVVDNAPGGEARALCDAWRARSGVPLVFAEEAQRGISFARNRAIREALAAGADAIAFVDDDDEPTPGWLAALVEARRANDAELVFGSWTASATSPVPAWLGGVDFLRPSLREGVGRYGVPHGVGTYNVLIAKSLALRVAPDGAVFLPEFARCGGGDIDFFIRAVRAGARFAVARDSRVVRGWDASRVTLRGIARRSFRLGHSQALLALRYGDEDPQRRLRRDASKLGRLVLALPLHATSRARIAEHVAQLARVAGRVNADLGRDLRYYGAVAVPSSSSR
jgi:glycosyltransferase involved in cell wall biosynthesis